VKIHIAYYLINYFGSIKATQENPNVERSITITIKDSFIIKNINSDRHKVIRIFNYPILYNTSRDLLAIPRNF
jgi:hypothetical protein